ncbi:glycogen/starch/alpha-glucan phosphorylase [Myxococcota bacterium]|nr:glycogen/starch/alpha-glucan phosphorylase [Myxococcota bacterium]
MPSSPALSPATLPDAAAAAAGDPAPASSAAPAAAVAAAPTVAEDQRTGMSASTLRRAVLDHLQYTRAKDLLNAHYLDLYHAVALAVRDRITWRWMATARTYEQQDVRRLYYFSAEYLPGRRLAENLFNLGLHNVAREELAHFGLDLDKVLEEEPDPGLGNGGLGRLAACFMESLATLNLPAWGYGIRYEFGIFRQEFQDGWQVEHPDPWLRNGNPWEIARPEFAVPVGFGGRVETWHTRDGSLRSRWVPAEHVIGVPYDTPVLGFRTDTVNTLRLWSARASEEFDLAVFNDGDYRRAVEQKALSESISKVLYPKDSSPEGKELRLRQQYFFVACSIADIFRRYFKKHRDLSRFADTVVIQLNDTHPAITIAELMRVLVDEHQQPWDRAWQLTRAVCAYTNHTLLPEALERWSLPLFERLLPRHLQIIYDINHAFLQEVHVRFPGDAARKATMSIIEESQPKQVRMANLAVVGSHAVNGVAALHTQLLRDRVLPEFAELWPDRFHNKTNGVTPRRWLLQANLRLADAISSRLGYRDWITDLDQLDRLLPLVEDPGFLGELRNIKRANKEALSTWAARTGGWRLDPETLFDVQVKRIHEYKRQLMLALYVVHLYARIKLHGEDIVPRTVLFGGKAAPGYVRAKQHIKLINDVASLVDRDPDVRGRLKVLFLPNYNVSMAERVIPAADLSEQISLAGMEASGTGNMKFQMNGALTIGTLDGANIEIREAVGPDAFFQFGMTEQDVHALRARGYDPAEFIQEDPDLAEALDLIDTGYFSPDEPRLHREVVQYVRELDPYMICADFGSYARCQEAAAQAWTRPASWWPMVARNILRSARFSSDRTIREYAEETWRLSAVKVELPDERDASLGVGSRGK